MCQCSNDLFVSSVCRVITCFYLSNNFHRLIKATVSPNDELVG